MKEFFSISLPKPTKCHHVSPSSFTNWTSLISVMKFNSKFLKKVFFFFHDQTPMIDFGILCFPLQFEEKTYRGSIFFLIPTFGNLHYFTKFKICRLESPL
jgi:hypothetical protein